MLEKFAHRNHLLQRCTAFGECEQLAGKMRGVLRGLTRLRKKAEQAARIHRRFDLGQPNVPGNNR